MTHSSELLGDFTLWQRYCCESYVKLSVLVLICNVLYVVILISQLSELFMTHIYGRSAYVKSDAHSPNFAFIYAVILQISKTQNFPLLFHKSVFLSLLCSRE